MDPSDIQSSVLIDLVIANLMAKRMMTARMKVTIKKYSAISMMGAWLSAVMGECVCGAADAIVADTGMRSKYARKFSDQAWLRSVYFHFLRSDISYLSIEVGELRCDSMMVIRVSHPHVCNMEVSRGVRLGKDDDQDVVPPRGKIMFIVLLRKRVHNNGRGGGGNLGS
jgi:hypothetical protein